MEDVGGEVEYPTVLQICETNRRMIAEFGGLFVPPDNLLGAGALEYILAAVTGSTSESYPTLKEKAAALAYRIVTGHVFLDGNKRTATHVAWEFLKANGVNLFLDESIIDLVVRVARGESSEEELLAWLHGHQ